MNKILKTLFTVASAGAIMMLSGCDNDAGNDSGSGKDTVTPDDSIWVSEAAKGRADIYTDYTLTADLSHLSDNQRKMISLLIDAAVIMDDLYWQQAYGDREKLLSSITDDKALGFVMKNYGPWDRLDG
ncbi:Nudix hydrolase 3, partial [hydrothermal vent metagenome]